MESKLTNPENDIEHSGDVYLLVDASKTKLSSKIKVDH